MYLSKVLIKSLLVLLAAAMLASCAMPVVKKVQGSRAAAIGFFGDAKWRESEAEATRAIDGIAATRRESHATAFNCNWLSSYCTIRDEEIEQADREYAGHIAAMQAIRAVARFELHDYSGARADARDVLKVEPENGLARYVLVREADRVGDQKRLKQEIARLARSPQPAARNMAKLIVFHYRNDKPGDWTRELGEIRRLALDIARKQGWGETKLHAMVVDESVRPEDAGYTYEVTIPAGWETLKGAPLVSQSVKNVNPIRDYDDVGAQINVVPMQALLGGDKPNLANYRAAFIHNLGKTTKYDTSTVKPYPGLERPGRQTAFWIDGIKRSTRELVIIRLNGPYAEVVSVLLMRSHDELLQRYLGDVNKILDSISIKKVRWQSFAERLRRGEPLSKLDRFRAKQESHFSLAFKAPRNWTAVPSFGEGKWNNLLRVRGDINISGALRVYVLAPEFGYSRHKYPDPWDFIASKYNFSKQPLPLASFTPMHLSGGWQARVTNMQYDPGRSLLIAKRQGKYVLVYSFVFIRAIADYKDRTPAGFAAAAAKNDLFRRYHKDIEYFVAHTRLSVH